MLSESCLRSYSCQEPPANPTEDTPNFADQPKLTSAALVKAAKQHFHFLFPREIAEFEAENDAVGQELQKQLEAAGTFFPSFWLVNPRSYHVKERKEIDN
ncbi:hypothetical protein DITRI_Ditri02bG0014100 [Diplodiscus trichospermus]